MVWIKKWEKIRKGVGMIIGLSVKDVTERINRYTA